MSGGGVRTGTRSLVAALCLVAACTGDDAGPAPTSEPGAPEASSLLVGLGGPVLVDPAAANPGSPSELMVADLLHDGLTALGEDGTIVPALAAEWELDEAGTTWRFVLVDDATFSDGSPLTSEDVVASVTRVAASGPSSLAGLRLEPLVGYDELVAGDAEELAGVRALDPTTVEIETAGPFGTLPAVLAAPEMGIVSTEAIDGADAAAPDLPLSGSWEVAEVADDAVTLAPRPDRTLELPGIELRTFEDDGAAYDAFDGGELDWAPVPGDRHDDAVDAHGDDAFAPFHAEVFLGLRVSGPLAAAPLRRAVAAAVDREGIAESIYADVADPLSSIVPAGVPGHDPGACGDATWCSYDPDAAREILDDAFADEDVPTVAIDFDDTERQRAVAEAVASDLEAVGIPSELRPHDRGEYRSFVASGDQGLFSLGWIGGYASPDAYLAPLFASSADDNLTGTANPELDLALVAARATGDPEAAAEAWASVERRALVAAVVVPIAQFRTQVVVSDRVEGLAHRVDGTVDWSAVSLASGSGS